MLEGLSWYYYGGSYFRGQIGIASGAIFLNPLAPVIHQIMSQATSESVWQVGASREGNFIPDNLMEQDVDR